MSSVASQIRSGTAQASEPPNDFAARLPTLRFANFEFDVAREQLRRDGMLVPLSPKPTALLRYFLQHPGRLISKAELMANIWGEVVVTDDSLVQCVGELRNRLGPQGPQLITTHPRRGYMFDAQVHESQAPSGGAPSGTTGAGSVGHLPAAWSRGRLLLVLLATILLALAAVGIYVRMHPAPYRIDDEVEKRFSIAVHPFRDVGNVPTPKPIREGLADEMAVQLTQLTPIAQWGKVVVARSGVANDMRYAMSGSLLSDGGGALVVELQVRSMPRGEIVWTERYEYPNGTAAGIGADIAVRAVGSLRERYRDMQRQLMNTPGYKPNPADLVLSAWDDIDRRQSTADVARARARFKQALRVDPDSVIALTGLGAVLMSERFGYSGEPMPVDAAESERVAERAIIIAPENVVALINWANVQLFRNRPDLAVTFFERAAHNMPTNANAHIRYAAGLMYMGRLAEAQAQCEAAMRIGQRNPRYKAASWYLQSNIAFVQRDYDKSYALAQRALAERPTYGLAYANLAAIDVIQGREEEGRKHMAQHRQYMPANSVARHIVNNPSGSEAFLDSRNRMVAALRTAGLPEK